MRRILAQCSLALVAACVFANTMTVAQARGFGPIRNNGPIVIQGPAECEKKLIQKCHWEGDRKVCVWVPGPDCEMF